MHNANPSSVEAIKSFSILEGDKAIVLGDMMNSKIINRTQKNYKIMSREYKFKCIFISEILQFCK